MARDDDSNKQPALDEETPLLVEQRSDHESDSQSVAPEENDEPESEPTPPKTRSWYLWRLLWTIAGALVIALFIKGWVDAGGDVDVCFSYSTDLKNVFSDFGLFIVRFEKSAQASSWGRAEWCCCYGFASFAFNGMVIHLTHFLIF